MGCVAPGGKIIFKWNQIYTNGITLRISTKISTLRFADEHSMITDSEDKLQRGKFTLQDTANTF